MAAAPNRAPPPSAPADTGTVDECAVDEECGSGVISSVGDVMAAADEAAAAAAFFVEGLTDDAGTNKSRPSAAQGGSATPENSGIRPHSVADLHRRPESVASVHDVRGNKDFASVADGSHAAMRGTPSTDLGAASPSDTPYSMLQTPTPVPSRGGGASSRLYRATSVPTLAESDEEAGADEERGQARLPRPKSVLATASAFSPLHEDGRVSSAPWPMPPEGPPMARRPPRRYTTMPTRAMQPTAGAALGGASDAVRSPPQASPASQRASPATALRGIHATGPHADPDLVSRPESESRDDRQLLHAQLAARTFVSSLVLGAVIRQSSNSAPRLTLPQVQPSAPQGQLHIAETTQPLHSNDTPRMPPGAAQAAPAVQRSHTGEVEAVERQATPQVLEDLVAALQESMDLMPSVELSAELSELASPEVPAQTVAEQSLGDARGSDILDDRQLEILKLTAQQAVESALGEHEVNRDREMTILRLKAQIAIEAALGWDDDEQIVKSRVESSAVDSQLGADAMPELSLTSTSPGVPSECARGGSQAGEVETSDSRQKGRFAVEHSKSSPPSASDARPTVPRPRVRASHAETGQHSGQPVSSTRSRRPNVGPKRKKLATMFLSAPGRIDEASPDEESQPALEVDGISDLLFRSRAISGPAVFEPLAEVEEHEQKENTMQVHEEQVEHMEGYAASDPNQFHYANYAPDYGYAYYTPGVQVYTPEIQLESYGSLSQVEAQILPYAGAQLGLSASDFGAPAIKMDLPHYADAEQSQFAQARGAPPVVATLDVDVGGATGGLPGTLDGFTGQIDATVSSDVLALLLGGLSADDDTARAFYAAMFGQAQMEHPWYLGDAAHEGDLCDGGSAAWQNMSTMSGIDLQDAELSKQSVENEMPASSVTRAEWRGEDRPWTDNTTKLKSQSSHRQERDLIVVKARPATSGALDPDVLYGGDGYAEGQDIRGSLPAPGDAGAASTLQVNSVNLLRKLQARQLTPRLPHDQRQSSGDRPSRPHSVHGMQVSKASTDSTGSDDVFGRELKAAGALSGGFAKKRRPQWDKSFYSVHERRIPQYEALVDDNCMIMCSPQKLKHIIKSRELHDDYLYLVRARFEQHRTNFGSASAADDRSRDKKRLSAAVACSPDWCNSILHNLCLRSPAVQSGFEDADEVATDLGSIDSVQDMQARWENLRDRIQLLWNKCQVPAVVRDEVRRGPLTNIVPSSLLQLQMHHRHLADYYAQTKDLIALWVDREATLNRVKRAHALGVDDARLGALQADLRSLEQASQALLDAIGAWSRSFSDIGVDATKYASAGGAAPPPLSFVWAGHDGVERIRVDSQVLARGDSHLAGGDATAKDAARSDHRSAPGAAAGRGAAAVQAKRPCPLVASALVAQKYAATDVLHDGPAPLWYNPKVAKAGAKQIRRGRMFAAGEKRK